MCALTNETNRPPLDLFSLNLIFEYFSKNLWRKFKFHENLTWITDTLHAGRYTFLIISHSVIVIMRHVLDVVVEKIKTHIVCPVTFFRRSYRVCKKVEKLVTGHQWQYNTGHALCMLGNEGYRKTLRICNTYCFSTATKVCMYLSKQRLFPYTALTGWFL
jgi:hypothetical protein